MLDCSAAEGGTETLADNSGADLGISLLLVGVGCPESLKDSAESPPGAHYNSPENFSCSDRDGSVQIPRLISQGLMPPWSTSIPFRGLRGPGIHSVPNSQSRSKLRPFSSEALVIDGDKRSCLGLLSSDS